MSPGRLRNILQLLSFLRRGCAGNRVAALLVPLALLAVGLPQFAAAQQYKSLPVNDQLRLDAIFAQGYAVAPDPAGKARFETFFDEYFFPAMTRSAPEHLAEMGTMRQDLFSRILWRAQDTALQKELTEKAFTFMVPILKDRGYHPAVQYNAILVIGLLDEEYAIDVGATRRPPKPLPNGNKLLVAVVDAAAQGKPVAPHLIVGALVGLERHARFHESLSPESIAATKAVVLKYLAAKENPSLDREVAAWIKLKAGNVLANLGATGQGNDAHLAIVALVGDKNLSLDDRCQAAALLKKLNYQGVKLDATTTVQPLVDLALAVARSEAKRARQFQEFYSGGGVSTGRQRRMQERGGNTSSEEQAYDRRQLLSRLIALGAGLTAVKDAVPGEEPAQIGALLAAINPVITSASNKDTVDLRLAGEVQTMAEQIANVAKPGASGSDDAAFANEF